MKKTFFSSGFTLVELLVALFILSTISTLVVSIVWVSLRSTVKINNMNIIRENSSYAVLQMSKMLQFAKTFEGANPNGNNFSTNCQSPNASPQDTYRAVRFTAVDDGVTTLRCTQSPSGISSNSASLINTNVFNVTSCSFTCTQAAPDAPYAIGFRFTVSKKPSGSLLDDPAPLEFQNSVTIRNSSFAR